MASIIQGDKKELISKFKSDPEFREEVLKEAKENLKNKIEDNRKNFDPSFDEYFAKQNLQKLEEYSNEISKQQTKESKGFFSKLATKLFDVDIPKSIESSRDMSGIFEMISSANRSILSKENVQQSHASRISQPEYERAPLPLSEIENEKVKPPLQRQDAKLNLKSESQEQKTSIGKFTSKVNEERDSKQNSKDTMSIG